MAESGRLGSAFALLVDCNTEIGLRRRQLLLIFGLQRLGFGELGVERGDEVGGPSLLTVERCLLFGEIFGKGQHLVGAARAVVERQATERILLLGLGVGRRVGEQRAQLEGAAGDELVDCDVAECAGKLTQTGLLLGDTRLRIGDVLIEHCLAVLRRAVVLVELADAVFEIVELPGDLVDLLLLAVDTASTDECCGGEQTADRDGGRDRSMKKDAPGPHAGESLPIITNLCRNHCGSARGYSHSMVPGGLEVMS